MLTSSRVFVEARVLIIISYFLDMMSVCELGNTNLSSPNGVVDLVLHGWTAHPYVHGLVRAPVQKVAVPAYEVAMFQGPLGCFRHVV